MTHRTMYMLAFIGLLLGGLTALPSRADDIAQAGRAIATKWKDSIVTIKTTAKMSMADDGQTEAHTEQMETTGTIISPTGLLVASLTQVDPTDAISMMMGDAADKMTIDVTGITVTLADGTEVPAKIVLRDKDLDLAFLRLKTPPAKPLTALDLHATSSQPTLLDQTILMYRLGTIANRSINVTVSRVEAILDKPRKEYVLDGNASESGAPVFGLDGNITGVLLTKIMPKKSGSEQPDVMSVVLPAADIAEAAAQAPATADTKDDK